MRDLVKEAQKEALVLVAPVSLEVWVMQAGSLQCSEAIWLCRLVK